MRRLVFTAAVASLLLPGSALAAHRKVPKDFVGMNASPAVFSSPATSSRELRRMVGVGVEHVRVSFFWSAAQPYRTMADVPPAIRGRFVDVGGVPTDWDATDTTVSAIAARHLGVRPSVLGAPAWAARDASATVPVPRDPADYARFMGALAQRYGPHGAFWAARPDLPYKPIRSWEIWNEENNPYFWAPPFRDEYVALLRSSRTALRAVDSHAKIVLGGLTNFSWRDLDHLYAAGAGGLFDEVSLHPYSLTVDHVLEIVRRSRNVMKDHGDRSTPIVLTELSWPASKGRVKRDYGFSVSERTQARRIEQAYPEIARRRHSLGITEVSWFSWSTSRRGPDPFEYSGLRLTHGSSRSSTATPAYSAFRSQALRLEGCRRTKRTPAHC